MPDLRKHRGAHPEDRQLFADNQLIALRAAVEELSWLLTRNYAMKSAAKLVGDRHKLTKRQRLAVSRAACSDQSLAHRKRSLLRLEDVRGASLMIDGFNVIITIEAALSGALLIHSRDGCIRDLSSVHGSYRSVDETERALQLIGDTLGALEPSATRWLLDRPVSNSGRLAEVIRDCAERNHWRWTVELVFNPDREIISSRAIVITADGPLLDQVDRWLNFNEYLIEEKLDAPWLIELG